MDMWWKEDMRMASEELRLRRHLWALTCRLPKPTHSRTALPRLSLTWQFRWAWNIRPAHPHQVRLVSGQHRYLERDDDNLYRHPGRVGFRARRIEPEAEREYLTLADRRQAECQCTGLLDACRAKALPAAGFNSTEEATREFLAAHAARYYSTGEIAAALHLSRGTIRAAALRMWKRGEVERKTQPSGKGPAEYYYRMGAQ